MQGKATKSRFFEKSSLKIGLWSPQKSLPKPCFSRQNVCFKASQKIFYASYDHVQGIQKVHLTLFFTSVKKSGSYHAPNRLYVRKSDKNQIFKNRVSKSGWEALKNLCQNPVFRDKTFASKPPRNFSTHLTTMFKVSRRST